MGGLPGQTWRQAERSHQAAFHKAAADELREELPAYFASLGLDWYATFTFGPRLTRTGRRTRPRGEWARKVLLGALNTLNRVLCGRRWKDHRTGIYGVLCWEAHADGHPHVHAMFGGLPTWMTVKLLEDWFGKAFRVCDVSGLAGCRRLECPFGVRHEQRVGWADWHPITAADVKVARYISKYILKDSAADLWEFYGVFDGRRQTSRSSPGALFADQLEA